MNTFAEFGLLATLQETLLEKGILRPTEIQVRALPALLGGRSIVGIAETGSGKTTQVPQMLVRHKVVGRSEDCHGVVGITQPRRVAAVSVGAGN
jgi:superfamily II DNA/RNA helicase